MWGRLRIPGHTYLNAAYIHPMPAATEQEMPRLGFQPITPQGMSDIERFLEAVKTA